MVKPGLDRLEFYIAFVRADKFIVVIGQAADQADLLWAKI